MLLNPGQLRRPPASSRNATVTLPRKPQWVNEASPTPEHLETLTLEEADLYQSLTEAEFGNNVRLEQERTRFRLLETALNDLHDGPQIA